MVCITHFWNWCHLVVILYCLTRNLCTEKQFGFVLSLQLVCYHQAIAVFIKNRKTSKKTWWLAKHQNDTCRVLTHLSSYRDFKNKLQKIDDDFRPFKSLEMHDILCLVIIRVGFLKMENTNLVIEVHFLEKSLS